MRAGGGEEGSEVHGHCLNVEVRGQLLKVGSLFPLGDLGPIQIVRFV